MRRWIVVIFILVPLLTPAQTPFERDFEDATMRVDYVHIGNAREEWIAIDRVYRTDIWAGSRTHLVDTFNNGKYYAKVYRDGTDELIYSHGFNSIFGEYVTTGPAIKGQKRSFHESALIPWPKKPIRFVVERRQRDNTLVPVFQQRIDPDDVNIIRDVMPNDVRVHHLPGHTGSPHTSLDICIVADGYAENEEEKAKKDALHFAETLLNTAPFNRYEDRIVMSLAFQPSQDSGVSMPTRGIYKRTAAGSSFNALDLPRYMLTEDNRNFRDIAGVVPYDIAVVMVNSDRYGGGGIYNFFCTFTADNNRRDYLWLHEFGHAFGGLADEYYSSNVSYEEFYPTGVEPVEPNITALLDRDNLKWKDLLTPGIALPTDWEKDKYDGASVDYQKKRAELDSKIADMIREGSDKAEIEKLKQQAAELSTQNAERSREFIEKHPLREAVGAFEGAGYMSEGLYRPQLDCIMFSTGVKPYCKVCEQAIDKRIKWFLE